MRDLGPRPDIPDQELFANRTEAAWYLTALIGGSICGSLWTILLVMTSRVGLLGVAVGTGCGIGVFFAFMLMNRTIERTENRPLVSRAMNDHPDLPTRMFNEAARRLGIRRAIAAAPVLIAGLLGSAAFFYAIVRR